MSSKEFLLWEAEFRMQPRGIERDNFHAALTPLILSNIHAPRGKKFTIQDFMHEDAQSKKDRETKAFLARMRAFSSPTKQEQS